MAPVTRRQQISKHQLKQEGQSYSQSSVDNSSVKEPAFGPGCGGGSIFIPKTVNSRVTTNSTPNPQAASSSSRSNQFQEGKDPLGPSQKSLGEWLAENRSSLRFNINFDRHPRLIQWFSAATILHFQKVVEAYVVGDGWLYNDFKRAGKERDVDQIFRCMVTTVGTYEQKLAHFQIALSTVLDAAKIQLLAPWKKRMTFGLTTCMKRQVGGLFLIHYLFTEMSKPLNFNVTRQPKVLLDPDDVVTFRLFMRDVVKLPNDGLGWSVKAQVTHVYFQLRKNGRLEFCLYPAYASAEPHHLSKEDLKRRTELNHFGVMKDLRDQVLYLAYQGVGNYFLKGLLSLLGPESAESHSNVSAYPPKKWPVPTPERIQELKQERNLAVISFRIFEVFQFIAPPNPYTPQRLYRTYHNYDDYVFADLRKALKGDERKWTKMPAKKVQRIEEKNLSISNRNRGWVAFLTEEKVRKQAGLTDKEILAELDKGTGIRDILTALEDDSQASTMTASFADEEDSESEESAEEELLKPLSDKKMSMPLDMPTFTEEDYNRRLRIDEIKKKRLRNKADKSNA
jgi:hypothetical protein